MKKEIIVIETEIMSSSPKGIIKLRYTPLFDEVGIISQNESPKSIYFYAKDLDKLINKLDNLKKKLKDIGVI